MYSLILNDRPDDQERREMLAFVAAMKQRLTSEGETGASSLACHALFASSRFQILE